MRPSGRLPFLSNCRRIIEIVYFCRVKCQNGTIFESHKNLFEKSKDLALVTKEFIILQQF